MDRNSIIGIVLIGIVVLGYSIFTAPNEKEVREMQRLRDSSLKVQQELALKEMEKQQQASSPDSAKFVEKNDSIKKVETEQQYGSFASAAQGTQQSYTIENELIKINISNLGAGITSVQLKKYKTYDFLPLILFDEEKSSFGFNFATNQNRIINTTDMYFVPQSTTNQIDASKEEKTMRLRLLADSVSYIEYIYTLKPNSYLLSFKINLVGTDKFVAANTNNVDFSWEINALELEKGKKWESQNTSVYYKYYQDESGNLSPSSDSSAENLRTRVHWIAFKQQFFSSVLIADEQISAAAIKEVDLLKSEKYLKRMSLSANLPFEVRAHDTIPFQFYFGPNHYNTLKQFDLDLESLVPLGWTIFGWVNQIAIIPLFNLLGSFLSNFGIIILIMTIIIKLILFPLTYKSYLSSAKMRVLKPQIDEITAKIPKENALERQQATMALYKKVGVSPLGGCLPMLLQFPILIAMYNFFPVSIELRQQSFLWANDLSSYDAIVSWQMNIPIISEYYGNHVSLFTLLMAVSMILTTKLTSGQMDTSNQQIPGMKFMMYYMMPFMMVIWFNNYSSGLSYYYFVANVLTLLQMLVIRRFVNDEDILKQLHANSAKRKDVKKSKFQDQLEKFAKQKGYKMPVNKK